ncbi:MAG: hypothetical protein Q7U74_09295 [Saprospiraceae bacterium]|nr:hypothetical protein [Saprospiraceae bacterium]
MRKNALKCLNRSLLGSAMVFALCFVTFQSVAQVVLRADSNQVETGNPLALHLRFPANVGAPDSIHFEVWENVLPEQNILSKSPWRLEGQFLHKTITALFFDEDSLEIPALLFTLQSGDTLYSNPLQLVVTATPSPDDLNDMAPIKDIHREATHWTDYWPWILGGLGVLALLGLMYWLANRKAKSKMLSRSIAIPAHELALKKLHVLAQKQWITQGFVKEHYAELTFILREYLENQFHIPALESTTEQTLSHLAGSSFPAHFLKDLQAVLTQADLAKFAKIIPPESFQEASMEIAKKIILETQLSEPLTPEQAPHDTR